MNVDGFLFCLVWNLKLIPSLTVMLALTVLLWAVWRATRSSVCYWCAAAVMLRARLLLLAVSQWSVHVPYPKSHFLSGWWAAHRTAGTGAAVLEPCWGICVAAPRILHFNHGLLTNISLSINHSLEREPEIVNSAPQLGKKSLCSCFLCIKIWLPNLFYYFYFLLFQLWLHGAY